MADSGMEIMKLDLLCTFDLEYLGDFQWKHGVCATLGLPHKDQAT
jgi:hypothetical protein